jgi:hypothetical protein
MTYRSNDDDNINYNGLQSELSFASCSLRLMSFGSPRQRPVPELLQWQRFLQEPWLGFCLFGMPLPVEGDEAVVIEGGAWM